MNDNTRSWATILAIEASVMALVLVGIGALILGARGADADHSMAAPPPVTVQLADVSDDIADNYRYASEHLSDFVQIPCYCGCDKMLGHRNLADCYVTPSGEWDAHAAGCAVCAQETLSAREQLAAGASIAVTADLIIEQYGPPPALFGHPAG